LRETAFLLALGIVIGLAGAATATRMLSNFLYGIEPNDPLTIVVATIVMATAVGLAGYLPARWASRVDPMVALRYE
jgi:ABC-type antimicrobial peptide transport system permease subunit